MDIILLCLHSISNGKMQNIMKIQKRWNIITRKYNWMNERRLNLIYKYGNLMQPDAPQHQLYASVVHGKNSRRGIITRNSATATAAYQCCDKFYVETYVSFLHSHWYSFMLSFCWWPWRRWEHSFRIWKFIAIPRLSTEPFWIEALMISRATFGRRENVAIAHNAMHSATHPHQHNQPKCKTEEHCHVGVGGRLHWWSGSLALSFHSYTHTYIHIHTHTYTYTLHSTLTGTRGKSNSLSRFT